MASPYTKGAESITQAEHISPAKTGDNIEAKRVVVYEWDGSGWQRGGVNGVTVLKKLIDDTTTVGVIYIGEAVPGSATSAAVWRIKKIDDSSSPLIITWSSSDFTKIWDNRTILTYT